LHRDFGCGLGRPQSAVKFDSHPGTIFFQHFESFPFASQNESIAFALRLKRPENWDSLPVELKI